MYDWAKVELMAYQRGILSVRYDFDNAILSWRDSQRMFNNFVRGLPRVQLEPVLQAFKEFIIASRQVESEDNQDLAYIWHVTVGVDGDTVVVSGSDTDSVAWKTLVRAIENTAKRNFKL